MAESCCSSPVPQSLDQTQAVEARYGAAAQEQEACLCPKAWNTGELVQLCERCSGKTARVFRVQPFLMNLMQGVASFFEPAVNVAERLAFAEVTGSGQTLDAPMQNSYAAFGLEASETTDMEGYIGEYYDTILKLSLIHISEPTRRS